MTQIDLYVNGAAVEAKVNGVLTGGMVGARVVIHYDGSWEGLHKTLVCRSCSGEKSTQLVRTVVGVGTDAVVAHEVMIPGRTLYLGLEGRSPDGTKVYPTIWAACGKIQPGANAEADPTADATPQVWEQLLLHIGSLNSLQTEAKMNLVEAINEAMTKGNGLPGRDGRGIVSVSGNPDGSWVLCYDDGTSEVIGNEAYMAIVDMVSSLSKEIAEKNQITPEFSGSLTGCTDINKLYVLPDGYIYAYMKQTTGGYTNRIPQSTDTDGSIYNGTGYKTNTRCNSSGEVVDFAPDTDNTVFTTGFIPCKQGDVIRLKNCYMDASLSRDYKTSTDTDIWGIRSGLYDSSKAKVAVFSWGNLNEGATGVVSDYSAANGQVTEFTIAQSGISYIRLALATDTSPADAIVTVNEQIIGGESTEEYAWASTGHAFVPADYEDRIIALEEAIKGDLPVYGIVDSENNIIMSGTLVKGTYTLKYLAEDGTITDIGEFTME